MDDSLRVDLSISPLTLPEGSEGGRPTELHTKMFLLLADHFRQFVLPSLPKEWHRQPPIIPRTHSEIKDLIRTKHLQDERRVIDLLSNLQSDSATIISQLNLTREIIREAMTLLRGEREHQVNLFRILSATRFRILTKGGLLPTICPRPGCFRRDSFWHLLQCYQLTNSVECGVFAVPFLTYLARKTVTTRPPRPWLDAMTATRS